MLDKLRCTAEEAFHKLVNASLGDVPNFATFTPQMPS